MAARPGVLMQMHPVLVVRHRFLHSKGIFHFIESPDVLRRYLLLPRLPSRKILHITTLEVKGFAYA